MATTTMTRWRPFTEIDDLRRRVEHLFEELADGSAREWTLAIDLIERDDKYVMRANVPGIKPDDVKIEVEDDVLTVSAQHEETDEEKKENYVRRERRVGSFSRSLTLPKGVTADQLEATCHDGVLEVTIPKPKPERNVVTITPKAG